MISNGCDAVTKLKKLALMGEYEEDGKPFRIDVIVSPTDKTIQFIDNGIGMTEEEVDKYINEIAFSGASAFLEQYKDKATEEQIIGHFGLGFYSAFMVADKVTIETRSYKEDEDAVFWECENGTDYKMKKSMKSDRGTVITLYLNEDSTEFANEYRIKEVIEKYCSFMPVEIYFTNADTPVEDAKTTTVDVDAKEVDTRRTMPQRSPTLPKQGMAPKRLRTLLIRKRKKRRSLKDLSLLTPLPHYGQSTQMTVQMRSTRNSTERYSMITRSHCSGST